MARLFLVAALLWPALAASQAAPCPPLDSLAPWARVQRAWQSERGQTWTDDSLRRELIRLRDEDQADRAEFWARMADSAYVRQVAARDSARAHVLEGLIARSGVPVRRAVGAAGVDAFMLLVQHHGSLQATVLGLASELPPGEVSPFALAMLEDRVRATRGQPQRYGTHFSYGADTMFHLAPVADPANLEARRAEVGLPPLATYVCMAEESGMRVNRRSLPR